MRMASRKLFSCTCTRGICNREEPKRNGCPCYTAKVLCTSDCTCGTPSFACVNRPGHGGDLDVEEPVEKELVQTSGENDPPWMIVSFEEGVTLHVPDPLNTSMQEAVELQLQLSPNVATPEVDMESSLVTMKIPDRKIDHLSKAQLKKTLQDIICFAPEMERFILAKDKPDPPPPGHGQQKASWCKCMGHCREMPTHREQYCCRLRRGDCITLTAAADINTVVLDRRVLQLGIGNNNALYAHNDDIRAVNSLRHMAYRFFVLWKYGYQGANNRRVIPSCVVWKIRDKYPSPDGLYTGYIPVNGR